MKEKIILQNGKYPLHGMAHTKVWSTWQRMKRRCYNHKDPKFKIYGAVGRFVCNGLMLFPDFYKIMGEPPTISHSIDRKDNKGSYTCGKCAECIKNNYPLNVHWATAKQQSRNISTNYIVEYNGVEMCLSEACEKAGVPYKRVFNRITYRGWDVDKALSVKESLKEKITINGLSLLDLSKKYNINKRTLQDRLKKNNWDLDKVLNTPLVKRNRKK